MKSSLQTACQKCGTYGRFCKCGVCNKCGIDEYNCYCGKSDLCVINRSCHPIKTKISININLKGDLNIKVNCRTKC